MRVPSGLYAIISDVTGQRILVTRTPSGASLPFVSLDPGNWSQVAGKEVKGIERAIRAVENDTDLRVNLLYRTEWPKGHEDVHRVLRVHAFESVDSELPATPHEWADRDICAEWARPFMADAVAAFYAVIDDHRPRVPWWTPGWTSETVAWMDDRLAAAGMLRAGRVHQVQNDWQSIVMRAVTDNGHVYLKALTPPATQELAVLRDVLAPGPHVPFLLGSDQGRGLILMRDVGGVDLSDCGPGDLTPEDIREVAVKYARIQRSTITVAEGIVFDYQLEHMPDLLSSVLDDLPSLLAGYDSALLVTAIGRLRKLVPDVARVCRAAGKAGIPAHVVHGDLHGNTAVTPDGPVFFDWGNAYVSHPFFDVFELQDAIEDSTEASTADAAITCYLEAWTEYGSIRELRRILDLLRPVESLPGMIRGAEVNRNLPAGQSPLRSMPYSPFLPAARAWQRGLMRCTRTLPAQIARVR
ncbi:phosphotransferase [Candidatus Poribacteria bacterium]|nr:phosphotransferase [Candidatus Poribacteria bacterium]